MKLYKVVEIFVSINGEGHKAGQLASFVRFYGCNLNCHYCDTRYACDQDVHYHMMSIDDILNALQGYGAKNVTLTGGEPLLQEDIDELIQTLLKKGYDVEIETNGSLDVQPFLQPLRPRLTLDYKVASSGYEAMMNLDNYQYLNQNDVVKFVVGNHDDLKTMLKIINQYQLTQKCLVYVSAIFQSIEPKEIVDFMIEHRLNDVYLQLQMHKYIWDPNLRGV